MFRRPSCYMSMEKQEQGGETWEGARKMTIVGMKWRRVGATNYGATAVALRGLKACRERRRRGARDRVWSKSKNPMDSMEQHFLRLAFDR